MEAITEKSIAIDGRLFAERRRETRQRVFKSGNIAFNGNTGVMECLVRNRSPRGAKLAFGDLVGVPPRFSLMISGQDAPRPAMVRWRGETELGVEFTDH